MRLQVWWRKSKECGFKGPKCYGPHKVTEILSSFTVGPLKEKEKNTIQRLRDATGQWSTGKEEVVDILMSYFQGLFTSVGGT